MCIVCASYALCIYYVYLLCADVTIGYIAFALVCLQQADVGVSGEPWHTVCIYFI